MALQLPVYLDHNATTPVDERVFEGMRPFFCSNFGNAASRFYDLAEEARKAVQQARERVAGLLHATSGDEIVWTSGATEADNLALKGVAEAYKEKGKHIITQVTEHKAVLDACKWLKRQGFEITFLPVDGAGLVTAEQVEEAIGGGTILVSIMWANNETGTIQPVREIGEICRRKGVLFHTDATQAVGHIPVDVEGDFIDLLSFSGHKFYGPKGCGGLYIRKRPRVRLSAQLHGGGHERGYRSGTLNVPGIVGVGLAAEIAGREMEGEMERTGRLRDRLQDQILSRLKFVSVNGHVERRLPHVANLSFAYTEGESILLGLAGDGIAASSASACTSESLEPSHVLRGMGVAVELAHCSVRFSLGRWTSEEQIDYVTNCVEKRINRLRELSPLYEMAMEGIDLKSINWTGH